MNEATPAPMCGSWPEIDHGTYRDVPKDRYFLKEMATYDCRFLHRLYSGHDGNTLTCEMVGSEPTWVGERTKCQLEETLVAFLALTLVFLFLFLLVLFLHIRLRLQILRNRSEGLIGMSSRRASLHPNPYLIKNPLDKLTELPTRSEVGIADETTSSTLYAEPDNLGSTPRRTQRRMSDTAFGPAAIIPQSRDRCGSIPHTWKLGGRMELTRASHEGTDLSSIKLEMIDRLTNSSGYNDSQQDKSEHPYDTCASDSENSTENTNIEMRKNRRSSPGKKQHHPTRYENYFHELKHTGRSQPRAPTPESTVGGMSETEDEFDNNVESTEM